MHNANKFVSPLLTDLYEITMAYAYFTAGKHDEPAVFDLFFRRNPFGGEFTVCAGISEVAAFVENYRWSPLDIDYVLGLLPRSDPAFRSWLASVTGSRVTVHAMREGNIVYPRVPVLRVEGPLGVCQLLESPLLNLVGYPSLVATKAARLRLAAGPGKSIVEFGLRRAQGPDGAVSASRYSYLGGADGTSNVLASRLFGIPAGGTQAHAYISSFTGLEQIPIHTLVDRTGLSRDFVALVRNLRRKLGFEHTHDGELAAFISYALAFPESFLALVDTYDSLRSGLPNAACVALALCDCGYRPLGIRLDSGDLAHLSHAARRLFDDAARRAGIPLPRQSIVASNEIDEHTIRSLNEQGHEIDVFGVGTHLVTCDGDPSLGVVYKLVEISERPRIKISEDSTKATIPGRKKAYRLYSSEGFALVDLLTRFEEPAPRPHDRILCRHPYDHARQTYVIPAAVEPLHDLLWDGRAVRRHDSLADSRAFCRSQIDLQRPDHLRWLNPTPYKVSLSEELFQFMHNLWNRESIVGELR